MHITLSSLFCGSRIYHRLRFSRISRFSNFSLHHPHLSFSFDLLIEFLSHLYFKLIGGAFTESSVLHNRGEHWMCTRRATCTGCPVSRCCLPIITHTENKLNRKVRHKKPAKKSLCGQWKTTLYNQNLICFSTLFH